MAIILNDVSARNDYVASAGQTVFPLTFKFFAASDLLVYQNGVLKTLTTHYTVAGAGADTGMAITLVTGATLSDAVAIVRAVPYERTTQLPLTGPFPVAALNTFLSKMTAMIQQVRDRVLGSITLDTATNSYFDALSKRIANVATPTLSTDAANKAYVDASPAAAASAAASQASAVASAASATSASSSATTATNALAATLAAYDSFDDRYLGAKASDPTVDNDGNALIGGTLYFNSTLGEMRIWTGSAWVAAYVSGTTFALKTANLSDLSSASAARTNLGLGTTALLNFDASTPITVAYGGMGVATLTANSVILGNGTSAVQTVAPGSSGNVLTSNGTTWQSVTPVAPTVKYLVTSSVDITIPTTTIAATDGQATWTTVGSSFTMNISANGTIRLAGIGGQLVCDATASGHSFSLGLRIGTTNYWFGRTFNSSGSVYSYGAYINAGATANAAFDMYGYGGGNTPFVHLDAWSASLPTGSQTVQLIVAASAGTGVGGTLKGTTRQTRVTLEALA